MIRTHGKEVPCEHCGKRERLQLLEYEGMDIFLWLCKDCYVKIEKRQNRLKERIKKFLLHPRKNREGK